VIVKKDGSTIVCRVVELTATEITYKKWSDLNGSNYVMDRSLASAINYENGKKETLGEVQNQYTPGNQNDGVQQYNDRALLALDAATKVHPSKKAKRLKKTAWIGGGIAAFVGIMFIANNTESNEEAMIGGIFIGAGTIWTTSFLLAANHQKKKAEMLQSSAIYQYDIKLSHGTSLSAGLDMLSDRTLGNNTLGLGLRYNF
jgi:hypothetical protein